MSQPKGWLLMAVVLVALMVMADEANATALWVMAAVGSLLASLPERIRRRKEPRQRSTWQGCLLCFAAGLVMVLSAALGQVSGTLATGLMQGCTSAWVFACTAGAAACLAARWRRKHP